MKGLRSLECVWCFLFLQQRKREWFASLVSHRIWLFPRIPTENVIRERRTEDDSRDRFLGFLFCSFLLPLPGSFLIIGAAHPAIWIYLFKVSQGELPHCVFFHFPTLMTQELRIVFLSNCDCGNRCPGWKPGCSVWKWSLVLDHSFSSLSLAICEMRKLVQIIPQISSKSKVLSFSNYYLLPPMFYLNISNCNSNCLFPWCLCWQLNLAQTVFLIVSSTHISHRNVMSYMEGLSSKAGHINSL